MLWRILNLSDCMQLLLGSVEHSVVHLEAERVLDGVHQNNGAYHITTSPSQRRELFHDCSPPIYKNDNLQRLGEPRVPPLSSASPPARSHALSTRMSPPSHNWHENIRDPLPYFPDGLLPHPQSESANVVGATSTGLDGDRASAAGSIQPFVTYHW